MRGAFRCSLQWSPFPVSHLGPGTLTCFIFSPAIQCRLPFVQREGTRLLSRYWSVMKYLFLILEMYAASCMWWSFYVSTSVHWQYSPRNYTPFSNEIRPVASQCQFPLLSVRENYWMYFHEILSVEVCRRLSKHSSLGWNRQTKGHCMKTCLRTSVYATWA